MTPDKRIKVLTIGRFYPPSHGGIERHIHELLQGLGKSVHADCIVFENEALTKDAGALHYGLYNVPSVATIASTPISPALILLVRRLQRLNDYDILHLHFPNPMAHFAAYLLPAHVKLVITWHSDIVKQKTLLKFYRPFLKHIVKRADAIIGATPAHYTSSKQLKEFGAAQRFTAIPYGIALDYFALPVFTTKATAIRALHTGKKIIFTLGRHVYYKGFEYLIRAMAHINDAVLFIAGTGPLTHDLQALSGSLNLNDKIHFTGRLPDAELAAYYHAADVFCLPSVKPNEAFGLVQVEAMACGKPIIGCELNNGTTYVNQHEKTGLVVPPRDPVALAGAINLLLSNDELRLKLGANAYQRAHQEFSQVKMWEKTLALYKKLLGSPC